MRRRLRRPGTVTVKQRKIEKWRREVRENRMQQAVGANVAPRRNLFLLLIVLIIDLVAFTCILPLFPSILDYYANKKESDHLYATFESFVHKAQEALNVPDLARYNNVFFAGLLGSLFSFLQYLSSPIFGALSDVYGRKPLLIVAISGTLISYYIWSIAETFTLFLISRIVGGLSKASISIAIAIVADLLPTESRGKGMAYIGAAFSVGFLIGPMIGAYFSAHKTVSSFTPAGFAMTSTILELIIVVFLMKETLAKPTRKLSEICETIYFYVSPKAIFDFKLLGESIDAQSRTKITSYGCVYFLYLFLYSGLEFTLSFFTHIRFEYDSMKQGRMYFFVGILMFILQASYVRRIPNHRQNTAALVGIGLIIPGYLLISMAQHQIMFYVGLGFYSIASAIVVPCITTLVSNLSLENEKGSTMGVFRSIGSLARACGPIFGASMFWLCGPTFCYAFGGLLLAIPLIMLRNIGRNAELKSKCQ